MPTLFIFLLALFFLGSSPQATSLASTRGVVTYGSNSDQKEFERKAALLKERAIQENQPPRVATKAPVPPQGFNRYPWKRHILTTIFWIGETPTANNPVPNSTSSWDSHWYQHFGGYDNPNPKARHNYIPQRFVPRQNPFYCALPYNDITRGSTKPEARRMIPWFKEAFIKPGKSVLKGRWIAINYNGKTCFAQWEDCGPFRTDHVSYVFGNDRPLPNLNHGAGLDVSPAVRDYLGLGESQYCDWKFVDASAIPDGPWKLYGTNNTFWLQKNGKDLQTFDPNNAHQPLPHRTSLFPLFGGFSGPEPTPTPAPTPQPESSHSRPRTRVHPHLSE